MTTEADEVIVIADERKSERSVVTVTHGNYSSSLRVSNGELARIRDAIDARLSTPPADDVRELLVEARSLVESWDRRGSWSADSPVGMVMRLADALDAAEVRRRGTVTDAEVEAGARVLDPDAFTERGYGAGAARQSRGEARRMARAILEAARDARMSAETITPTNHENRSL